MAFLKVGFLIQWLSWKSLKIVYSIRRLAAAQVELDAVMATLKEKQDSLGAVEAKVLWN